MHATEWDPPEYLTREQWDAGDYWSAQPLGGGERHRYGMSTNWTYTESATSLRTANPRSFFVTLAINY